MNPYAGTQSYQNSAVLTATPEQLVVMLYDGAIRFLRQAEIAMREGAHEHAFTKIRRGEAIINELLVTLNMDVGELSVRLQAIYFFCKNHLIEARRHRDPERITQVVGLLSNLREAWDQLAQQAPSSTSTSPAGA